MESLFAERITGVPRSFIREILKVSLDPSVISFAGGLPNPKFFPVDQIREATQRVFSNYGASVLQYSNSEGDIALRELIAKRYETHKGLNISPENIIITNGSQQGLDLLGKVLLNDNDRLVIEKPGYLGAIQSLSLFRPEFVPVQMENDGMDVHALERECSAGRPKLMYSVPIFQNPSGVSYSESKKEKIAAIVDKYGFVLVEDDPYGELRFSGEATKSFHHFLPEMTVLLGSFSKVVAPGLRLGWIVAKGALYEKLLVAKQASDLHTSSFSQKIVCEYLLHNDLDAHIAKITEVYGEQCRTMQNALGKYFSKDVEFTNPEGGMFLWGSLPAEMNSMALFDEAVKEKVVFVPGDPFYTSEKNCPSLRLNFSCVDSDTIEEGVLRMAKAFSRYSCLKN